MSEAHGEGPPPVPHGYFRVYVDTEYGPLVSQDVPATNLRQALSRAYALPLLVWFPEERDGPVTEVTWKDGTSGPAVMRRGRWVSVTER